MEKIGLDIVSCFLHLYLSYDINKRGIFKQKTPKRLPKRLHKATNTAEHSCIYIPANVYNLHRQQYTCTYTQVYLPSCFFCLLPLPSTLSFSFYTYRRGHMHSLHMLYATWMRREPGFGSGEREEQHRTAETMNWGVYGLLQKIKAIIRCKMHHLDPQCVGTNRDLSLWLFLLRDSLVGSHPVHETAVQKERDGSREGNWFLPRLVCAEKNQGWSRWERGLLLMRLKRQDFVLGVGCWD